MPANGELRIVAPTLGSYLAVVILTVAPLAAQVATGGLFGTVVDPAGQPVSGVQVSLRGLGALQVQQTDGAGQFRYLGLDPASYQLTVRADGFAPLEYGAIAIRGGRSATMQVDLVAEVQETISVTAESPLLDERKLSQGTILSQVELETLPTARDPWAVLNQAPGVLVDRINVGGNMSGQQSVFIAPANVRKDNDWQMDGVQITDMSSRSTPTYFDFDQFSQMEVSTGGNDIRKSTPGVGINLVTKRGSNEFRGSARYIMTDADGFFGVLEEADPVISDEELGPGQESLEFTGNRTRRVQDLGFEAGGAAVRDRVWIWGSWAESDIAIVTGNGQDDATTLENTALKVNAQIAQNNSFVANWTNGNKTKANRGAGPSRSPETLVNQRGPSAIYRFEDTHIFGSNLILTATLGLLDGGFALAPTAPGTGLDGPDPALNENGVWTQNWWDFLSFSSSQLVQADVTRFLSTGSLNHEVTVGGRYRQGEDNTGWLAPGRGLLHYAGVNFGAPFDFVDAYRGGLVPIELERTSLWAQDTLTRGRFTLNVGLRWDREEGRNLPATIEANKAFPELLPALEFEGNDAGFGAWSTFLPRLGFTYALGASRQTLLRASYARFAQALGGPAITRSNPLGESYGYHIFFDQNGNHQWDSEEIDGEPILVFASGFDPEDPTALDSPNRTDPNLSPEITDELVLGVEHAVRPELVVGLNLTWRHVTGINEYWALVRGEDGVGRAATRDDWVFDRTIDGVLPDGSDYVADIYALDPSLSYTGGDYLTNGDRSREYRGLSVHMTKRLANRWALRGYVTYGRALWDVPNSYFDHANPTNEAPGGDRDGEIFFEVGKDGEVMLQSDWAFNLNGIYQVAPDRPWGFNVSGTFYARQGYPLSYFDRIRSSVDGAQRLVSIVENMEDFRAPDLYTTDLRIEKEFAATDAMSLTLGLDVFNALNDTWVFRRELTYNSPRGDWLNETVAPRIFRLGVRLSFR